MSEGQTTDGNESQESSKDSRNGNISETTPLLDKADSTAERLEKAASDAKREGDRLERLQSRERLGGKSSGAPQVEEKKEISDKEYAEAALQGKILPKK